jgi:hypothetical protein
MNAGIPEFLALLKNPPSMKNVFNPWRDRDRENDVGPGAPEIRLRHLKQYFEARLKSAEYLLIGEAIGYQGGHFSGIAMTSERILLGYKRKDGINPEDVLADAGHERTSKPEISPKGFSEPTATIVWGTLLATGLRPGEFVLWNIFPWHPFDQKRGILSNRRPSGRELEYAAPAITKFLDLFPGRKIIALGNTSYVELRSMGIECYGVRHPANAGAKLFRDQIGIVMRREIGRRKTQRGRRSAAQAMLSRS